MFYFPYAIYVTNLLRLLCYFDDYGYFKLSDRFDYISFGSIWFDVLWFDDIIAYGFILTNNSISLSYVTAICSII